MESSRDRILTTHTGSLPRSAPLLEMLLSANKGKEVDPTALARRLADDTDEIVRKQLERGIDIGGDGELPRIAFHLYVKDRMSGFGGRTTRASISDIAKFPRWAELALGKSTLDDAEADDMSNTAEAPAASTASSTTPNVRRPGPSSTASRRRSSARGTSARSPRRSSPRPRRGSSRWRCRAPRTTRRTRPRRSTCSGSRRSCATSTSWSSRAATSCNSTPPTLRWSG